METFWAQAPRQMPLLAAGLPAPTSAAPESAPSLEPAKKPKRRWIVGVAMAAAAVALSFAIPDLQRELSRYMTVGTMPAILPKAPDAPPISIAKVRAPKSEQPIAPKPKPAKAPQRFEGPQIELDIPADVRAKVSDRGARTGDRGDR